MLKAGRLAAAGMLWLLLLPNAFAASPQPSAVPADRAFAPAAPVSTPLALLKQKARDTGEVRLLVTLQLPQPFRAEGRLPRSAVAQQRARIARARSALLKAFAGHRLGAYAEYASVPVLALRADAAALDGLLRSPLVAAVDEDLPLPPTLASSGPVLGMPAAWSQGYDGSGQAVVIVDTGIDAAHAFFDDASGNSRIVAEACFSNAGGFATSLCPDGSSRQSGPGAADATIAACLHNGDNLCYHGTHVAGIAAGNDGAFDGVARGADIIALQVFTRFDSDAHCGSGRAPCVLSYISDQLAALDHVTTTLAPAHTIAAVNMSLGGGGYTVHCDTMPQKAPIDTLRSLGIATIIAAGNDGYANAISSPACVSSAVSVGSTTDGDDVSSFSNAASFMHLFAPGSAIESSIPGGGFASFNGTSMAAPQVAGAWALLRQAAPAARVDDVLAAMIRSGVTVTDRRPPNGSVTRPRLQVDAALAAIAVNRWHGAVDADWHHAGNWSLARVPSCADDVLIDTGADRFPVLAADASARHLSIANGAVLTMTAHTLTLCGDLDVQGAAGLAFTGGSVQFIGSEPALLDIAAGGGPLHHLRIGDGNVSKVVTLQSDATLGGDLVLADGATIDGFGQALVFAGADQRISLRLGGAPGGVDALELGTLTVAPGATLTLDSDLPLALSGDLQVFGTFDLAGVDVSVEGVVDNVGTLRDARSVVAAVTTALLAIDDAAGTSTRYRGVELTPDGSLGLTRVSISGDRACTVDAADALFRRCFSIEPTTARTATLRLWLTESERDGEDASSATVLRWTGAAWGSASTGPGPVRSSASATCGDVDGDQCWIEVAEVDAYGRFAVGSAAASPPFDTRYTITPSAGANGAITPSTAQRVDHGTSAVFTVAPDPGHVATVGGTCGGSLVGATYTTAPAVADCTVSATFALGVHAVTPSAGSGGRISPATVRSVTHGATTSFTVTPDDGHVASVGGNCGGRLDGSTYTTDPIVADCSVIASFALDRYTVTPSQTAGGSLAPLAPQQVEHGATTRFTVTPQNGHVATIVGDCGGSLVGDQYTTGAITGDCAFSANFTRRTYTVAPSSGSHGSITPATAQQVAHEASAQFTVTPDTGFVASVGGSCGGQLVGNRYTTHAITGDCTVVASFAPAWHTVFPGAGVGGSITPATPQAFVHGSTATFTVVADAGHVASVGGSCGGRLVGTQFTTDPIIVDCHVTATFALDTHVVTPGTTAGGRLSPATAQQVSHGSQLIFTVTADPGHVASVAGSCGGRLDGGLYFTDPIVADCTVAAAFARVRHRVTPSADAGGSITPATVQDVEHGSAISFTVTADANRTTEVGGSCGGSLAGTTWTTAPIVADCTVAATFPPVRHRVFPGVSGNGAIEPYSLRFISHGATASYAVTVAPGHRAVLQPASTCGGAIVNAVYTTSPVRSDCEFYIRFEPITHRVTPNAGPGGALSPGTVQQVSDGGRLSFEAVADTGHDLVAVAGSCGGTLSGASYTTDPVVADCTVDAVFAPHAYQVSAAIAVGPGSVTPSIQSVDHGDHARFGIVPASGWFVQSVDGDRCAVAASADGQWRAGPIDQDCAITIRLTQVAGTVATIATSAGTVRAGLGVRIDARIDSAGAAPLDGVVDIVASSGERCNDDDPVRLDDDSAGYGCELTFGSLGSRTLVARFGGAPLQAPSESPPLVLDVAAMADVSIAIVPVQVDFEPGDTVVHRIEVRNAGPDAAPASSFAVVGDPALHALRWTCMPVGATGCVHDGGTGAITMAVDLAPGGGLDLLLAGDLAEPLPAMLRTDAAVDVAAGPPHHVFDPQPGNNTAVERTMPHAVFADGFERRTDPPPLGPP